MITHWVKASKSNTTGDCVEMRGHDDAVEVRDTKAMGTGPILSFASKEFAAWVEAAKRGEFDHLTG